jgi:probable O-glycosylation ligase (exosortase A-associated)
MRDYLLILFMAVSLPIGVLRPYYGMLLYSWLSFMYPHQLTWSLAHVPLAKFAALATMAGIIARQGWNGGPLRQRENVLMMLLWGTFTLSTFFAINPSVAWDRYQDASKLVVMALLTSMLLTNKKRIRYFLLVVALSLGFYGLKVGYGSVMSGGQDTVFGPGDSIIGANNNLGLALNMALPFLWYLGHEERGYLKVVLYAAFFLCIPGIMFTYSRASALTIPVVLLAIFLKGRNRLLIVGSVLAGIIFAIPLVPDRFWDRQETVLSYEKDGSAMGRIENWKFCWALALDRPLTGGGFQFHTHDTVAKYAPEYLFQNNNILRDTHSIYLGILATHGFPGIFFFLMMIASCFISCEQMQRKVRYRTDLDWVKSYCCLVEVSFLALLVNGAFVNMEYYDLVYDLVAVVASLRIVCRGLMDETGSEEQGQTSELAIAT